KVLQSAIAVDSPLAVQLEREARVLGGLSHPNVVVLHAFVKSTAQMFSVLEFVDGCTLSVLLKKRPTLAPDAVAAIGAAAARGLAHVHERGFVHRDLKPANILLSHHGDVKLSDFGIAQLVADARAGSMRPSTGADPVSALGTPAYTSPEQ